MAVTERKIPTLRGDIGYGEWQANNGGAGRSRQVFSCGQAAPVGVQAEIGGLILFCCDEPDAEHYGTTPAAFAFRTAAECAAFLETCKWESPYGNGLSWQLVSNHAGATPAARHAAAKRALEARLEHFCGLIEENKDD